MFWKYHFQFIKNIFGDNGNSVHLHLMWLLIYQTYPQAILFLAVIIKIMKIEGITCIDVSWLTDENKEEKTLEN